MTQLRGVFLTSEDPEAAARFYGQVARLPMERVGTEGGYVYWRLDRDGVQLAIHDAKAFADYSSPAQPGSNLTHLYFQIEDQGRFLAHLQSLGLKPYATRRQVELNDELADARQPSVSADGEHHFNRSPKVMFIGIALGEALRRKLCRAATCAFPA